jgi:hypothetical protein
MQAARLPPQLLFQHDRLDGGGYDLGEARVTAAGPGSGLN